MATNDKAATIAALMGIPAVGRKKAEEIYAAGFRLQDEGPKANESRVGCPFCGEKTLEVGGIDSVLRP